MEDCGDCGGLVTFNVNKRRKRAAKSQFLQIPFRRNLGADSGGLGFAAVVSSAVRARVSAKGGRPSLYSDAVAEKIVELIAEGFSGRQNEAMDGMPSHLTMLRRMDEHPEFCKRSARARSVGRTVQ